MNTGWVMGSLTHRLKMNTGWVVGSLTHSQDEHWLGHGVTGSQSRGRRAGSWSHWLTVKRNTGWVMGSLTHRVKRNTGWVMGSLIH